MNYVKRHGNFLNKYYRTCYVILKVDALKEMIWMGPYKGSIDNDSAYFTGDNPDDDPSSFPHILRSSIDVFT